MKLSQQIALSSSLAGTRPWKDAPREFTATTMKSSNNSGLFDRYKHDYEAAGVELRAALADGEWHEVSEVREIAAKYGIKQTASLMDRCGVYHYKGWCYWSYA